MVKFFLIVLLILGSVRANCEDNYSVVVGSYDINETENLKFILELKKIVPKENTVVIYDSKHIFLKTIIVENFKSDKEANDFNAKLKAEFKANVVNNYVLLPENKNKFLQEGASQKFNLLIVKSKSELPIKSISEKYIDKVFEEKTKKNEVWFKIPVYEKGSKQDNSESISVVMKNISSILIDHNIMDFNFETLDYANYEVTTVLVVTAVGTLPTKELMERFKNYILEKKLKNGEIWLRLSMSEKTLSAEEIALTSVLMKDISTLLLNSNVYDFNFVIQKYREKDNLILNWDSEEIPLKEKNNVEKNDFTLKEMENNSDQPKVGAGFMGNNGLGGVGGNFGQRHGSLKKRALLNGGGNLETETSIDWALWWLANHQEKDGHWDSGKYEGSGTPEVDAAATASALLAFLGAGHTDRVGKWKLNVKNAVAWLVTSQKPDGSWDTRNYANGFCVSALAEAYGMGCGGPEVKKSAELAVDYLLKQQNASGFFDYTGPSARDDMSTTGWCISAYKSALLAGIKEQEVKNALQKCGEFLNKAEGTKDNSGTSKGEGWYTPGSIGSGAAGGACQAIAMTIRQYIGWTKTEPWMAAAISSQISQLPRSYASADIYRIYYASLVLFQIGGSQWETWNEFLKKTIVSIQRQDGDFKGSWDKNGCHLDKGGRVMYTTLLCLTLENYYRYKKEEKN